MPPPSYKKARRMIKSSIAASARQDIEAEEDGEIEDETDHETDDETAELIINDFNEMFKFKYKR